MQSEPIRIYKNKADLRRAVEWLAGRDKRLAHTYERHGLPDLRARPDGFSGLVRLLISQQVSTAAAAAIQAKFDQQVPSAEPHAILSLSAEELAACGISRPKQRYLRILAEALESGDLDLKALHRADNTEIYNALTALTGIGPWTAECYLLFSLRRRDVFPAGDLALQQAYKMLYRKRQRPDAKQLAKLAKIWSPHRGAAARLLWHYYNGERKK